ncbi:PVR cell adhesion molecule related 2 like isoform X1 [Anguilla anguilla]|uniref:PVR cell adhesion molecule related 2 like isoform X1 n=1 Tax=Anguilla anguilla TaxID=7936 RepID=UPI0015AE2F11|nr:PVR cell adhesion molecule related 2 like isoform X1 [Anguilla anguilla]
MARDYAGKCLDFRKNCGLSMGFILIIIGGVTAHVKVKSEVESYPGQMVNLSCEFMSSEGIRLTQVSWIWEPKEGQRENIAVFHPQFGDSYPESALSGRVRFLHGSLENPSISISDVRMTDEGKYVCEYATYPSGNEQGTTTLVMLAKPKNTASVVTVTEGTSAVVVARCESADGRPEAEITWETQAAGKEARTAQAGVMNTVTVLSEYRLVPTAEDDGRDIACVVSHRTQGAPQILRLKLSIEHLPKVRILGYDSDWYRGRTDATLVCEAIGNPEPTNITWKTASGPLPDTVQVRENTLTVRHVDEAVNTTFVCEAQNRLGASTEQVTTLITEPRASPSNTGLVAGAVVGGLLGLLLLGGLAAALVALGRRRHRGYRGNGGPGPFGGKKANKNGAGGGGGNNNGPIYTYREGEPGTLTEKANDLQLYGSTPTAHDILLSSEMDEAERRKFDRLAQMEDIEDEDEERYDHFGGSGPTLHIRRHDDMSGYLDDDMESQRDGSIISRTAVYV